MACNFNCIFETAGLLKVTGSYIMSSCAVKDMAGTCLICYICRLSRN